MPSKHLKDQVQGAKLDIQLLSLGLPPGLEASVVTPHGVMLLFLFLHLLPEVTSCVLLFVWPQGFTGPI